MDVKEHVFIFLLRNYINPKQWLISVFDVHKLRFFAKLIIACKRIKINEHNLSYKCIIKYNYVAPK